MKKSNSENKITDMFANQNILEDSSSLLVSDSFDFSNSLSTISNDMSISKFSSLGIILKNFLNKSILIDQFSSRFFENLNFIFQEFIFNKTSDDLKSNYSEKSLTKIQQSFPSMLKQPKKNSKNNINELFLPTDNKVIKKESQFNTTNYIDDDAIDILPNFDEISYSDAYITLDPKPLMSIIPTPLSISKPIKVHVGDYSENLTSQLNADAVALKDEIFVSKDNFDLTSPSGLSLLVHEITHVQQYRNKNFDSSSVNDSHEQEALENESHALSFFKTVDSELPNFETPNIQRKISKDNTISLFNNYSPFLEPFSEENDMFFSINTNNQFIPLTSLQNLTSTLNITPNAITKENTSSLNLSSYSVEKNNSTAFTFHSSPIVQENSISNINNSNLQSTQNQNTVPMTADENRNVQSTSIAEAQESPVVNVVPSVNIEKIATQVFDKISKQILLDRDRLGYR